ncbi:MAG TPA: hypothetical protein VN182_08140 [Flavobacterium sp.]|jgi:CRISPR/Cas system-associated protein endoribonuclease Cas2|nr:hypothetical protein [Flavobacterium sp.]
MLIKVRGQKLEVGRDNFKFKKFLFGICFLFFEISSYAQCAMCRAALAGESNKVKAEAVNDGIVYLMVIPYLLVAGIGYYVYRMRKKNMH